MKDKKKLVVLIALVVVIVAVGAFQFVGGGSSPAPAPVAEKAKDSKQAAQSKQPPEEKKADEPKNALFAADLAPRDPFDAGITDKPAQQPQQQPAPQPPKPHFDKAPALPSGLIEKGGGFGNAPVTIQAVPEPQFSFTLGGVMLGAKPMAVFKDGQGNERLVMLGGSLDPDSKVVSIDKDAVTVKFHGKAIKLTVEGNPNAK